MTSGTFKAAAAQMTARENLDNNLEQCRKLAAQAASEGVTLLVLPENFAFLGVADTDKYAVAETLEPDGRGPIVTTLTELAVEHQMWIIGGGMPERVDSEAYSRKVTTTHNTAVVVSPAGELVSSYRKIHLFDIDIPGKAKLCESANTTPGTDVVACETDLGTIGLSICYDLRFPELYRQLVVDHGAEIVVVPAAFTAHTGRAHWHALLRARAIENQCFVIAAAQTGRHNEKRASFGHASIYGPWGDLLAELEDGTGLAIAELDRDRLAEVRTNMPCGDHIRVR